MSLRHSVAIALMACGSFVATPAAHAETFSTCADFIDSVPTTITTQGVHCLRHDLATSVASGAAITINANNVTIDCNDFKLGGLAAGSDSTASGIYASGRQNVVVRHCSVRGFDTGIDIAGGAGHLVEDNRLDNNLTMGIYVYGDNSRVRRNAVYDTGNVTHGLPYAIYASADIVDNTVDGVIAPNDNALMYGIRALGSGTRISGNHVSGMPATVVGLGISLEGSEQLAADNNISSGGDAVPGKGLVAASGGGAFCSGNTVAGFATAIENCQSPTDNGNLSH